MNHKATLVEIHGEDGQEEYGYMVPCDGTLCIEEDLITFIPESDESIELLVKKTMTVKNRFRVYTKFGNCFIFKIDP